MVDGVVTTVVGRTDGVVTTGVVLLTAVVEMFALVTVLLMRPDVVVEFRIYLHACPGDHTPVAICRLTEAVCWHYQSMTMAQQGKSLSGRGGGQMCGAAVSEHAPVPEWA